MRGTLHIKSKVGEGTTVEMWVPTSPVGLVRTKQPEVPAAEEVTPARILVVDDDALISMNTVDLVEDLGHVALEANSGRKALEILAPGSRDRCDDHRFCHAGHERGRTRDQGA